RDSMRAAEIEIVLLEHPAAGVHALDVAQQAVPFHTVPIDRRQYGGFAAYYARAGRPDKARATLAQLDADVKEPRYRRALDPVRHAAMAEILLAEHKPLEAVRELWRSDSLPDGPA